MPRAPLSRIAALVLLVGLAGSRMPVRLMTLPFIDRAPLRQHFASLPDRGWEGYPEFLAQVRARTRNGDRIAIMVPARHWDDGYSYAYYRASYFLAGRQVVPLVQMDDRMAMDNLRAASYLAAWRMPPPPGHPVVWQGSDGVLVKR